MLLPGSPPKFIIALSLHIRNIELHHICNVCIVFNHVDVCGDLIHTQSSFVAICGILNKFINPSEF